MRMWPVFLVAVLTPIWVATVWAGKEQLPFDRAEIFLELNATDGDLGVQFFFDADGWEEITIVTPDGRKMVDIKVKGNAGVIGLTEVFSESAEPSFDELSLEEFLALFPEGEYQLFGKTVEGDRLVGEATLTHDLPDPPEIVSPEEDEEVNSAAPVVIEWNLVADPDPPASVIIGYQVVVEKDQEGEPELAFSVDMPATATSVTVPPEFLEPGKGYKVEVIAIETSGNKTITEVPFETAGP